MVSEDGSAFMCMRVESSKPFEMKSGETAFIHVVKSSEPRPRFIPKKREPPKTQLNFQLMLHYCVGRASSPPVKMLADKLGIPEDTLRLGEGVGCVWMPQHKAWGFPMMDGNYKVIGIRLRDNEGRKWAVTGSSNGIFYSMRDPQETMVVCEGPTDTAAALACGFFAVGRPSCSAGVNEMLQFIANNKMVRRVIIVSDNDEAGLKGAKSLEQKLPVPSCTVTLPCKDMRDFYKAGGDRELLESIVHGRVWTIPSKK